MSWTFPRKEYKLAEVAPVYADMSGGGQCKAMEAWYLAWLAYSANNSIRIPTPTMEVQYGESNHPKKVQAVVIQKKFTPSDQTWMVLKCERRPELEGIVLGRFNLLTKRPFCAKADYSLMSQNRFFHEQIIENLKPLGIELARETDLLLLLLDLMERNNLKLGVKFAQNVGEYTQQMVSEGLVAKYWNNSSQG